MAVFFFATALASTACGENIFDQKWIEANVDTVLIYSLARPELNLPSGFDFLDRRPVTIQSSGATWDLLLDTQDGQLVFLLPGSLGITTETLILAMQDMAFDDVLEAPKDTTLYTRDQPILVESGTVYVLRTRMGQDRFGLSCTFFGKLQPVVVDPDNQTVQFAYDVNTLCDDRALIPTDD